MSSNLDYTVLVEICLSSAVIVLIKLTSQYALKNLNKVINVGR